MFNTAKQEHKVLALAPRTCVSRCRAGSLMSRVLCRSNKTLGKTMTLAGPKAWTVDEVIELCEKYADARADVSSWGFGF